MFRVSGLGFGVKGSGVVVWDSGFEAQSFVQGFGGAFQERQSRGYGMKLTVAGVVFGIRHLGLKC